VKRKPSVAIVGLGLVGGSLARALTRAGYAVCGVDRAVVLRAARRARAITVGAESLDAVGSTDVIVLAAPPRANVALLARLADRVDDETIVTDVGSVKTPICRLARERGLRSFVGGHPMAGSERSGFAASRPDLFEGHSWILTPAESSARAVSTVRRLAQSVGARVRTMRPDDHDGSVAFLSHLPQVVSWAIDRAARADGVARKHLALAGPGFRDMTRLARSPHGLWREILEQNHGEVGRALAAFARALGEDPAGG
jgi:prephenate dehydrogenase